MQTYHTLQDMRVVFLDGTVLDTADPASREAFLKVRPPVPTLDWRKAGGQRACSDVLPASSMLINGERHISVISGDASQT